MTTVLKLYRSLLADVVRVTGVPLAPPSDFNLDAWVYIDGPQLDKTVLTGLEKCPDEVHTLEKCGLKDTLIPEWFRPLWDYAWDGYLHPLDLRLLRQVLVFCYKVEHEPTKTQLQEAVKGFVDTDDSIGVWDSTFNSENPGRFYRTARSLIAKVLSESTLPELLKNIVPSHGPGAVYPPSRPERKTEFWEYYIPIAAWYNYDEWFWTVFIDDLPKPINQRRIKMHDKIACRLTAVPKDSRGPRLICVHPKEAIWIQQGQRRWLEAQITKSRLTRRAISFTDQTQSGERALYASSDKSLVTLDLKDASDRISNKLVSYLFGGWEVLSCARASEVILPDGTVHTLKKWAPMGNCLTFPLESLVFWALCSATQIVDHGVKPSDTTVFVFGDDIQYPPQYHSMTLLRLVCAGLVPNASKTFARGYFRESCGVDAFMGVNVTPLRLRKADASPVVGAVAFCMLAKRARQSGYYRLAAKLYDHVRMHWNVRFTNNPSCGGISEFVDVPLADLFDYVGFLPENIRYNSDLQRWETSYLLPRAKVIRPRNGSRWNLVESLTKIERYYRSNGGKLSLASADDESALDVTRKSGLRPWAQPVDSDSSLQYADPNCIRLTIGWTPVTVR